MKHPNRKRHRPEEIVAKLRQADEAQNENSPAGQGEAERATKDLQGMLTRKELILRDQEGRQGLRAKS